MRPYDCANRHQCWESCGELGKSAEHARPAPAQRREATPVVLEPCPFCKQAPSHVECMDIGVLGIEYQYAVMCYCGAQGPEAISDSPTKAERKAARLWNRRRARAAAREASCDSPVAPAAALTVRHESEPGGKNDRPLPEGPQDASPAAVISGSYSKAATVWHAQAWAGNPHLHSHDVVLTFGWKRPIVPELGRTESVYDIEAEVSRLCALVDGKNLNAILPHQPTVETLACWLLSRASDFYGWVEIEAYGGYRLRLDRSDFPADAQTFYREFKGAE